LGPRQAFAFADDVQPLQVVLQLYLKLVNLNSQGFLVLSEGGKLVVIVLHVFLLHGHAFLVLVSGFLQFHTYFSELFPQFFYLSGHAAVEV